MRLGSITGLAVIASEAKQSMAKPNKVPDGLLRFARNDDSTWSHPALVLEYLNCPRSLAMKAFIDTAMMEHGATDCRGDEKGIGLVIV
jgi:hypothetical protein